MNTLPLWTKISIISIIVDSHLFCYNKSEGTDTERVIPEGQGEGEGDDEENIEGQKEELSQEQHEGQRGPSVTP